LSLLELLVTVAILATLVAVSVPFLLPHYSRYQLRSAAWQVAGDLRLARQRAVSARTRYRFAFTDSGASAGASSYVLQYAVRVVGGEQWMQELPRASGARQRLPGRTQIDPSSTPATRTITFNPNGSVVPTGTIRLRGSGENLAVVTVDQVGRVQVSRP
jgi:Tfp pilus assembly protein FimT